MINIEELETRLNELQDLYDKASSDFQSHKAGRRAHYRKAMRDYEQQIKHVTKQITEAELANQGIDSKAERIGAIGKAASDTIGHIADTVSAVYGGEHGKFGTGAAEIERQKRIGQTGAVIPSDLFGGKSKYWMIGIVGVVLLFILMKRK